MKILFGPVEKIIFVFLFFISSTLFAQVFKNIPVQTFKDRLIASFVVKNGTPVVLTDFTPEGTDSLGNPFNDEFRIGIGDIDGKIRFHVLNNISSPVCLAQDSSGNFLVGCYEQLLNDDMTPAGPEKSSIEKYDSAFHFVSKISIPNTKILSIACSKSEYYFLLDQDSDSNFGNTPLLKTNAGDGCSAFLVLRTDCSMKIKEQSSNAVNGRVNTGKMIMDKAGNVAISVNTFVQHGGENNNANLFYLLPDGKMKWHKEFTCSPSEQECTTRFIINDFCFDEHGNIDMATSGFEAEMNFKCGDTVGIYSWRNAPADLLPSYKKMIFCAIDSNGNYLWKQQLNNENDVMTNIFLLNGRLMGACVSAGYRTNGSAPFSTFFFSINPKTGVLKKFNSISGKCDMITGYGKIFRMGEVRPNDAIEDPPFTESVEKVTY